jgi:hypothetical protein
MRQREGIEPRDEQIIVGADMVSNMEGSIRGAKGQGPREPTGVEDRGTSTGQSRELGRSDALLQSGGRAVQPAYREDAQRRIGSRMPPYERGRGVTPAEQRGARTVTDSIATPATRRGGHAATTGIESTAKRASIPSGDRLYEEACAGKPPAGFCEGETHNGAWSNTVTLPTPKGGSNREHKADLHIGGVLPTRPQHPIIIGTQHDAAQFLNHSAGQDGSTTSSHILRDGSVESVRWRTPLRENHE